MGAFPHTPVDQFLSLVPSLGSHWAVSVTTVPSATVPLQPVPPRLLQLRVGFELVIEPEDVRMGSYI